MGSSPYRSVSSEGNQAGPPPPAKTWLYAGYVGTQQNFCTLQKYGAQYAQRILVLMDAAIPMATEDKSDISWPIPPALRFTKVATAAMSEERMRKEARTCMRASLVLIGTNGQVNASEQAMVPGWMRLWPLMHSKYTNMDDLARHSTSQPALKRELALELSTRTNAMWWWTDAKGAIGQAVHTGILPLETGTVLEQSMPLHQRAHLGAAHYWQSSVLLATGKAITFRRCPNSTRPQPPEGGGGGSILFAPTLVKVSRTNSLRLEKQWNI